MERLRRKGASAGPFGRDESLAGELGRESHCDVAVSDGVVISMEM